MTREDLIQYLKLQCKFCTNKFNETADEHWNGMAEAYDTVLGLLNSVDVVVGDNDLENAAKEYAKKMLVCAIASREMDFKAGAMWKEAKMRRFMKKVTEQPEKELLNKLEEIQAEYKGISHDAKSKENYIYASGLCEATERIIKFVKNDEE